MLELPGVTLVCADTANHALALRALAISQRDVRYGRSLFLTDAIPPGLSVPEGIEVIGIDPLASRDAYSQLMLKALLPHIDTSHALVIQWDGYVVNPKAWDAAFYDCDYIGAKWYWADDGLRVGNGGFSLRSRKLLAALQDPRITLVDVEDTTIARTFRPLLEREHAIRFADEALADRFSFEAAYPVGRPFGFHGLFNFCRTVPPSEIAILAPTFSDAIARSMQLLQLLRNCIALGQWDAAQAMALRILAANPEDAEARASLARAQLGAAQPAAVGRNEPCPCGSGKKYKQCHGALSGIASRTAAPATTMSAVEDPDDLVRSAIAMHERGDLEGAERGYRFALALAPAHPTATHYLGVVLYQRERFADALPLLRAAAAAVPNEPEFHNNLGLALAAAGQYDEAIAAYQRALALRPEHSIAWSNLGLALQAENRLAEAIAAFRSAISLAPDLAQAHWNLGLALLANEEFEEGWREYEWRHKVPELARYERAWPGPRWDGTSPVGRTLLLTTEQGLGDTLQFIRLAKPLAACGARVLVSAPQPLVRLLASAPGVTAVYGPDDALPPYDAHVPLIALAGILGVTAGSIPASVPYLGAEAARRAEIAPALVRHAGTLRVGLAWSGSLRNAIERLRAIKPQQLAPLFALPDIVWYSLKRESEEAGIENVAGAQKLQRLPARNDFDGLAALASDLDLVITVDTSIAHLAGALARPTWILLIAAADWRWHPARVDSPWYPTARLFRQPRAGDWDAVIRDVVAALGEFRRGDA
jgi:tetratricopeptide (TPR) repeat protein